MYSTNYIIRFQTRMREQHTKLKFVFSETSYKTTLSQQTYNKTILYMIVSVMQSHPRFQTYTIS